MSYNDKLAQTGRKVASARRKYYGSFDYDSGLTASKRGGTFSFGRKFDGGGSEDDVTYAEDGSVLISPAIKLGDNSLSGSEWGSLISGGIGILGMGLGEAQLTTDRDTYNKMLWSKQGNLFGINDNTGLMMALQNNPYATRTTAKTFNNKTGFDVAKSALGAAGMGATAGSMFGPVGAAIGAGIGGAVSLIGSGIRGLRANTAAKKANELEDSLESIRYAAAQSAADSVDARNDWLRMYDYYNNPIERAFGGPLHSHGGDYGGGLTFIDEGGRHEENPFEGVPSGYDGEGNQNLVEEGEVIWNNEYVFSDRLKVPEELAKKYKLGGKKYTFAEAIEKLTKENTISPTDLITIATTREIVNEFMDAQEELREQNQLAAKEELDAAQDADFLAQLEAAQGMAFPMGAPVNMPQMGMGMPNEAPVTEGQMMPPGYAFGGNKFEGGGDKWREYYTVETDENGEKYYVAPDGTIQYSEAGAKKNYELNADRWIVPVVKSERVSGSSSSRNTNSASGYTGGGNGGGSREVSELSVYGYPDIKEVREGGRTTGYKIPGDRTVYSDFIAAREALLSQREPAVNGVGGSSEGTGTDSSNTSNQAAQPPRRGTAGYSKGRQQVQAEGTEQSSSLPPIEYQANLDASGIVSYDRDKIHQRFVGYNTKGKPMYEYTVYDENGKPKVYTNYEEAARKYSSIIRDADIAGGKGYKDIQGNSHVSAKGAREATAAYFSKNKQGQSGTTQPTKAAAPQAGRTAAYQAAMFPTANQQDTSLSALLGVPDTVVTQRPAAVDTAATQQPPVVEQPATRQTAAPQASAATPPTTRAYSSTASQQRSTQAASQPRTGSPSSSRRPNAALAMESDPLYKGLVERMDNASKEEQAKFVEEINNSLPEGSKKMRDYAHWRRNATDGNPGSIHNATLNYARRHSTSQVNVPDVEPTEFDPNVPFDSEAYLSGIDELTGVQPISSLNATTRDSIVPFRYRDTSLRLAPMIGASMASLYGMLNRPNYSNADRIIDYAAMVGSPINIPVATIGDYRRRDPFDEMLLVNIANQNRLAGTRGIVNTSAGNRSMDLLGNMGLAHSNQYDLAEIGRQAYLANRQDDASVAEFNRGTNLQNMSAINQRNSAQAQLNSSRQQAMLSGMTHGYGLRQTIKDNWDNATMESINSALASAGAYAKENEEYNMLTSMAEHGYFPYYYGDRGIMQFSPYYGARYTKNGGKLNRKKRRF